MDIKKEDFVGMWNSLLNMERELFEEAAKMEEFPLFRKRQIQEEFNKKRRRRGMTKGQK